MTTKKRLTNTVRQLRRTLAVSALLAVSLPFSLSAEESPADFLARFGEALKGVRAVFSEFTQERQMEMLAEPLVSSGAIMFSKPGRVRWETSTPYQSILISNGDDVVQFESINGQWRKIKIAYAAAMKNVMESLTMTWSGRLGDQQEEYTFDLRTDTGTVLTMTPRSADVREFIQSIEMHFDDDLTGAHKVVLNEPSGDRTIIRFTDQRINPDLSDRCFDLDEPTPLDEIRQALAHEN